MWISIQSGDLWLWDLEILSIQLGRDSTQAISTKDCPKSDGEYDWGIAMPCKYTLKSCLSQLQDICAEYVEPSDIDDFTYYYHVEICYLP